MISTDHQATYQQWATGRRINFVFNDPKHDGYLYRLVNHMIKSERAWLERIIGAN
jgi:hypothetical protein